MVVVNLKEKHMSETLASPVVDPSEFSPEELDEIREQERLIDEELDNFLATSPDTEEAFKGITESLASQAEANPKAFLAAREKLSVLTDEEDPTDDEIDKSEILKDVIDGPFRARIVTKYGVFETPTPEVRRRVERAIAAVRDAETAEAKVAHKITLHNQSIDTQSKLQYQHGMLQAAIESRDPAQIKFWDEALAISRRSADIKSRGTGYTEKALHEAQGYLDAIREDNPDIPDDHPRVLAAQERIAKRQADYDKVVSMIPESVPTARERLRNLLKEHPEGIDVVHDYEEMHDKHATNEDAQKDLLKAREKHEAAQAKIAELQRTLDPGDARIAIAQIEAYPLEQAYESAARNIEADTKNADLLTELANENAHDKTVRETHEATYGKLADMRQEAIQSLLEWKDTKRPIDEQGSYVAIKQIENYIAGLDEKIALAPLSDRYLPHYRNLRDEAFHAYVRVQYAKEFTRTEMYANAGDFEGRYPLGHAADKGILLERADGSFIIYPDASYSSIYEEVDADGNSVLRQTPRVYADGELATGPVLEQIADPRALIDPATVRAWEAMTTENLKNVDSLVYREWMRRPDSTTARAYLEVVSGMLRERTAGDGTSYAMEATYMERYLAIGREGNPDQLINREHAVGSIAAHMTLFDIEGDWVIHANGNADLYTPGTDEPISRYAADGTILNAYGPEEDPDAATPEDGDDDEPDGLGGGTGGTPSTPTPSPSAPVAPTPPVRPTPGPARPGTVSAAGAAPTPPAPPTPESGAAEVPKSAVAKEREAREARKQAVEAAKNHTVIMTSIAPPKGTLAPRGEYEQGKSYVPLIGRTIFGDGASRRTTFRVEDELWKDEVAAAQHISPETFYISPVFIAEPLGDSDEYAEKVQKVTMPDGTEEEIYRVQYRFDAEKAGVKYPTAGDSDNPDSNILVTDALLPKTAALGLLDAFALNTSSIRDFARDLYVRNVENGEEIWNEQGGRPPYDKLPADWKISFVMPDLADKSVVVSNRLVRR